MRTDALRAGLTLGGATATVVARALLWVGCVLCVAVPDATHRYQRATESGPPTGS